MISAGEEEEEHPETDILDRLSDISFASGDSSFLVRNTDTESENEEYPVLKKPRPKHKWFVVPEILNRYVLLPHFTNITNALCKLQNQLFIINFNLKNFELKSPIKNTGNSAAEPTYAMTSYSKNVATALYIASRSSSSCTSSKSTTAASTALISTRTGRCWPAALMTLKSSSGTGNTASICFPSTPNIKEMFSKVNSSVLAGIYM